MSEKKLPAIEPYKLPPEGSAPNVDFVRDLMERISSEPQRQAFPRPTPQPAAKPEGEEKGETCWWCNEPVAVVWNAATEVWSAVMKGASASAIICPECFHDEAVSMKVPVWFAAVPHGTEPCSADALLVLKAENAEIAHELAIADKSAADAIEVIHRLQAENARLTATCEDQRRVISEMTADESRDIDTIARLTAEVEHARDINDFIHDRWDKAMRQREEFRVEIAKLKAELDEAQEKVKSWEQDFNMYRRAWIRELGGLVIPKHHDIDALVLTTRDQREKSLRCEAAESRLSALTTENAGLREALTAYHEEWKAELLGGAALALSASRKGGDRG
jgi:FtsZ-binding cell division protein ZapB